jgi:hypothetical protein|tara:strand:+ start:150 stop:470 length:321 start_codon:yes stop_codon:yes gene_type:complete
MKFPMKLNRSHVIVSLGSMVFIVILMSVLGYLKFSEGYESPEALEAELKQLMDEMTASPVVQELISSTEDEVPMVEPEPELEEGDMEMMAPDPMQMELMGPGSMDM